MKLLYTLLLAFFISCSTEPEDCAGVAGGSAAEDCAGICGGDKVVDNCDVCDNDATNDCTQDCSGEWGGSLVEDCSEVCGGTATIDNCDVCSGGNSDIQINDCNNDGTIGIGLCQEELITLLQEQYKTTTVLSYNDARDVLYGVIDNDNGEVYGVYTNFSVKNVPVEDPRNIVHLGGINCEHIWPQSMFIGENPMKSDLHHLRPSKSNVNSSRSNKPYGDILDNQTVTWYWKDISTSIMPASNIDEYSETKSNIFEPREDSKGDIARSMFYFYTMYTDVVDIEFFNEQKEILKNWHVLDPVNEDEINRTWAISVHQENKPNPFILDSTLIYRTYFSDNLCEVNSDNEVIVATVFGNIFTYETITNSQP